jgi:hypothetical protein
MAARPEAVGDLEAAVDGPGIGCAVDGTIAINRLRNGWNSGGYQAHREGCQAKEVILHRRLSVDH